MVADAEAGAAGAAAGASNAKLVPNPKPKKIRTDKNLVSIEIGPEAEKPCIA
jgi:hypothetical protein